MARCAALSAIELPLRCAIFMSRVEPSFISVKVTTAGAALF